MRTAIFLAGMLIQDGLTKSVNYYPEDVNQFLAIIFVVFVVMDLFDFFNFKTDKK